MAVAKTGRVGEHYDAGLGISIRTQRCWSSKLHEPREGQVIGNCRYCLLRHRSDDGAKNGRNRPDMDNK